MTSQVEREAVFYCEIGNAEGLRQARDTIKQEQAEADMNGGVRIRVRREEVQGRISFECTTKSKMMGAGGISESLETTVPVDEAFFKAFCKGANHILRKTRYVFRSKQVLLTLHHEHSQESVKLNDLNFEVDVYNNHAGDTMRMVKVDVEVDSLKRELTERFPEMDLEKVSIGIKLGSLPFEPENIITADSATDEQKQRIDKFWEEVRLPV